ncbi:hypothetical protein [Aquimarina brevivitae]|nr:hypothetical protein [Aquimarina brevivitae]
MRILVIIVLATFFSCKKSAESRTEVLEGTEVTKAEPKEVTTQNPLGDVFGDQIIMEVDETVFVIDNGTNRANEDMSAGIMKMLAPQPYATFKERMLQKQNEQQGIEVLSIEETELEGKKVLLERSKTLDDAGEEMMMVMYAFPASAEKTIMISSYYMKNEEKKYLPLIEQSVLSARLRE